MTGTIYIVGIGPGSRSMLTDEAYDTIIGADVVVGYTTYINLLKKELGLSSVEAPADFLPAESAVGADFSGEPPRFLSTPMRGETERCRLCFKEALCGRNVALVCSGDAGVYGMASLIYELSEEYPPCDIRVVSGITAAASGAALLGAPLGNDFCTISLSDYLTPWPAIEKRLLLACEVDFVIAVYNPASKKRPHHLRRACELLLPIAGKDRPCGIAANIGRKGQWSKVCPLSELSTQQVDMFTTVFIGNSKTRIINGRLITPRGY